MRLTLSDAEVETILKAIHKVDFELCKKIQSQLNNDIQRDITNKQNAIREATKARETKAKAKIESAINLLRMESRSITAYAIAKESRCSYNTVKKYFKTKEIG